jgi:hypothetical protein
VEPLLPLTEEVSELLLSLPPRPEGEMMLPSPLLEVWEESRDNLLRCCASKDGETVDGEEGAADSRGLSGLADSDDLLLLPTLEILGDGEVLIDVDAGKTVASEFQESTL